MLKRLTRDFISSMQEIKSVVLGKKLRDTFFFSFYIAEYWKNKNKPRKFY